MQGTPIVSMRHITKTFAGVKALNDVNIDIRPGSVHGLIGANGAGKSTLIKILAGAYSPDAGEIEINGEPVVISNPNHSARLGLSFIHQELSLVENFNALENITMGLKKETSAGFLDWKKTGSKLRRVIERIGFKAPLTTPVKDLSVAEKWLVAIARALYQNAKVIAMDEPTASLSNTEVDMLFDVIRELTAEGIGIIYVSHRLDEILEICDEITIFKDGNLVMYTPASNVTKQEIINAIAGREVQEMRYENSASNSEVLLSVEDVYDERRVKGVSLKLHKGQILGVSGLVGSGRTELAGILFGINKCVKGAMTYKGERYSPKSASDAVKKGIAIVPEERRSQGLITNKSVGFNINIPFLSALRLAARIPFLSERKGLNISNDIIDRLKIKTAGPGARILSLSGGNQQKVVIGKWLGREPELILMDEPTRGVDVGARAEIYKLIKSMAQSGISFIIISSDMDELPGLCDKVIVMAAGKVTGELYGGDITKEAILRLSYAH